MTVAATQAVPVARGAELRMTFTDAAGETHDYLYPLLVLEP